MPLRKTRRPNAPRESHDGRSASAAARILEHRANARRHRYARLPPCCRWSFPRGRFALRLRNQAERVGISLRSRTGMCVTSSRITTPVTIGPSVLLPSGYVSWDEATCASCSRMSGHTSGRRTSTCMRWPDCTAHFSGSTPSAGGCSASCLISGEALSDWRGGRTRRRAVRHTPKPCSRSPLAPDGR